MHLGKVIEVWILNNNIPVTIIHYVIKVCDSDFRSPILFVVKLGMPMYSNWAHVRCALYERRCILLFGVCTTRVFIVQMWVISPTMNFKCMSSVYPVNQFNSSKQN